MARVAACDGNVAALEDARDRAVLAVEQLQDQGLRFKVEPVEDELAGPLKQMADMLQQKLLAGQRREPEPAKPIAVDGTMYPPNAHTVPGAVYSPGEPLPR